MSAVVKVEVGRDHYLSANHRNHWTVKARKVKVLRVLAFHCARAEHAQPMQQARLTVHIVWPDRRRRDAHNAYPTIKACIDGIIDAGLLPDDNDTHLDGPYLHVIRDITCGKAAACQLIFDFEDLP